MDTLVKKAKRKDQEAFCTLIRACETSMYRAAKAILSNDEDVADAMQETILTCWEKLSTLRAERYFKTWLMRILINQCYDLLAARRRVIVSETQTERGETDSAYTSVEWRELLDTLDEAHRAVIILYYVEGFKVREIAEILQLNVNTVKYRLVRARKAYEELITSELCGEG